MPTETTQKKHSNLIPFKPGVSGNPNGRPKGSRHKISEDFVAALAEDFAEHGKAAIVKVRETKPEVYIRVIADLLPKDMNLNVNHYEHMTDAQLLVRLRQVREVAGRLLEAESDEERDEKAMN